jgi:hypothetical protein
VSILDIALLLDGIFRNLHDMVRFHGNGTAFRELAVFVKLAINEDISLDFGNVNVSQINLFQVLQ